MLALCAPGFYNRKFFVLFLFYTWITLAYVLATSDELQAPPRPTATPTLTPVCDRVSESSIPGQATRGRSFEHLNPTLPPGLGALCDAVIMVVICGFWIYHMRPPHAHTRSHLD